MEASFALQGAQVHPGFDQQRAGEEAESVRDGRWLDPIGLRGVHAALTEDGKAIALLEEKGKRSSPVLVVRPRGLFD